MRLLIAFLTKTFISSIFLLLSDWSYAQVLPSSANLSYLYNNSSSLYFHHQLVSSGSKTWILLETNTNNIAEDSLVYGFAITPNLDKPIDNFTKLNMKGYRVFEDKSKQIYAIDVSEVDSKFVVFRVLIKSKTTSYTYIVELGNPTGFTFSTSLQLTIPDLSGYAAKGSILKISTLNGSKEEFGVKFFSQLFKPALPPMSDMKKSTPLESPDTTYTIFSGDLLPTEKIGTYALFNSANEEATTFYRIEDPHYPKAATVNNLINASVYILTADENKKLKSSTDLKKTYDSFWLNNTNSAERAGRMISGYFNRVKEANEKFTTFKEGWKTDMGMIYIIFGPPDKAFRTNNGMQWVYKKTYELPSFTFTFYANNKYLTSEYYELERGLQYQRIWFRAVELWRKGRKSL